MFIVLGAVLTITIAIILNEVLAQRPNISTILALYCGQLPGVRFF